MRVRIGVDDIKNLMIVGVFVGVMSEIFVFFCSKVVIKVDVLLVE